MSDDYMPPTAFELEDFNPKTGHLHACGAGDLPCRCGLDLYELTRWLDHEYQDQIALSAELISWRDVARQMNEKMLKLQDLAAGWGSGPPEDIARSYAAERVLEIVNALRLHSLHD